MSPLDWIVLIATLLAIIAYGLYKSRTTHNLDGYFLSNRSMSGWLILLSIMGTQASAITFLSAPGQAYTEGMGFVQYYFGIPLASIVICIFFVPIFRKLHVYTAYEYLESRFDGKTRTLTSLLFLLSRGLSTGISILAPSIILSSLLHWNIYWTNLVMGGLLIIYTMTGGARAVAHTQKLQLIIIFSGLFLAGYMVVAMLPTGVGLTDALAVGGRLGRMNIISSGITSRGIDWSGKYNLLTGLIGGFFLSLSYFGTDQSQVGRYLTGRSVRESRLGLLLNGFVKIPMQFLILLIGVLVFTFYQFNNAPVFFNQQQLNRLEQSDLYKDSLAAVQQQYAGISTARQAKIREFVAARNAHDNNAETTTGTQLQQLQSQADSLRGKVKGWIRTSGVTGSDRDTDYIFLRFAVDYLPAGLVGLLIAIIFLASWGSIAAAINSLASCTMVDFHRRMTREQLSPEREYRFSRRYTLAWGVFSILVALFIRDLGNSLIESVNILGSLFYGVILGVFAVAFFFKKIRNGNAIFWGSILAELVVILFYLLAKYGVIGMGFLWLNPIGVIAVILFAGLLQLLFNANTAQQN